MTGKAWQLGKGQLTVAEASHVMLTKSEQPYTPKYKKQRNIDCGPQMSITRDPPLPARFLLQRHRTLQGVEHQGFKHMGLERTLHSQQNSGAETQSKARRKDTDPAS